MDWEKEYVNLMFGESHSEDTMDVAAKIKYYHMPEALYKYRSFSSQTIEALENDCLYSSPPDLLNDIREAPISFMPEALQQHALQSGYDNARKANPALPKAVIKDTFDIARAFRDCAIKNNRINPSLYPEPSSDEYIIGIANWAQDMFAAQLGQHLHTVKNMYNVCCFSATLTEDLMWSHYAEGHKGFCIQYDFKSLGLQDENVQLMLPVFYQESPQIRLDNIDLADANLVMYALSLKDKRWAYEKEWRRFYKHTEKPNPEKMPKPKAIILGANVKDANMQKMKSICRKKAIPLYQMILQDVGGTLVQKSILF